MKKAVRLTPAAREDINWWMQNTHIGSKIWVDPVSYHIVTDASGVGWGAYVNGDHIQGSWMPEELRYHANMKELLAIYKVLTHGSIIRQCRNRTILIQSDNRTALAYLRKQGGTRSINLLQLTRLIYSQIETYNISLVTSYLPGPLNSIADGGQEELLCYLIYHVYVAILHYCNQCLIG
ncbi:putative transposon Ty3-I Gag-Pol polyprotein [Operophtera brumata]|uniref:Putative transposon Ty3-I Gag-Pol polyprotein n=1 Tax=Operophtera brumata TaxID=104452 RepID=A0A0L7LCI9_OPEBR|nr:putative transposon Ty3-I Gag-Pol polyprotein [Operophtera brumata]